MGIVGTKRRLMIGISCSSFLPFTKLRRHTLGTCSTVHSVHLDLAEMRATGDSYWCRQLDHSSIRASAQAAAVRCDCRCACMGHRHCSLDPGCVQLSPSLTRVRPLRQPPSMERLQQRHGQIQVPAPPLPPLPPGHPLHTRPTPHALARTYTHLPTQTCERVSAWPVVCGSVLAIFALRTAS